MTSAKIRLYNGPKASSIWIVRFFGNKLTTAQWDWVQFYLTVRKILDGVQKSLLVHRKGSTRAFPPHHPLIPVDYQVSVFKFQFDRMQDFRERMQDLASVDPLWLLLEDKASSYNLFSVDRAASSYRRNHGDLQVNVWQLFGFHAFIRTVEPI